MLEITRLNVSCEGIPFGRLRNVDSHFCLARPYISISSQVSAPQITAVIDMVTISKSSCCLFPYFLRLSSIDLKKSIILVLFIFVYSLDAQVYIRKKLLCNKDLFTEYQ